MVGVAASESSPFPESSQSPFDQLARLEGVPSAFAAARDGIDVLLRDRGLRRTSPEATAQSLLRGAWASAVLEGSETTQEQLADGQADEVAQAAVRVSTQLLSLIPVVRRTPAQAFARIHALAAGGLLPDAQVGRPRSSEAATRLQTLGARLVETSDAPALLVAAVTHAELATAAPFASHNGIVARAAERLVMAARGVDEKSLIVPEAGHLALRAEYESNLRAYAKAEGSSGVHAWLLYAPEAFTRAVQASPLSTP